MLLPVVSPAQSADWDARAAAAGISLDTLMDAAGRAAAHAIAARWPHALGAGALVACGTGHNGGDGWVVARALQRAGARVFVTSLPGDAAPLTARVRALAEAEGMRLVAPDGPWPAVGLAVEAILGTGASGAPRAPAQALLDRLHELAVPLVAIDGPAGLDLGTGAVHGVAHADASLTFGGFRRGHLLSRDECGEVLVLDIGHPAPDGAWPRVLSDAVAASWLPPFRAGYHKGDRGRVVVIGGAAGMSGAARMACRAAFAAGAGLVHLVAPAETVAAVREADPDVQTLVHTPDAAPGPELFALLARADALVIGPGLGREPRHAALVVEAVSAVGAAVVDADALVLLAGRELSRLAEGRRLVLTPHAGEFRTLFPAAASRREVDPWAAAEEAAATSGAAVLLKGVPTVVAQPQRASVTVAAGNPGLATGGSGDVLAGLVGALLARGLEAGPAAALGAQA
ncbi:MAG: NAD(P)H-hydrate dehydratase, partial [Gemmatimonadales bacterium]|nr:NAD(P)H-hydrate dehydratase [Gemmatimonadales bacterium]